MANLFAKEIGDHLGVVLGSSHRREDFPDAPFNRARDWRQGMRKGACNHCDVGRAGRYTTPQTAPAPQAKPLARQGRLAVSSGCREDDDLRLGLIKKLRQPWAPNNVALRRRKVVEENFVG